MSNNIQRDAFGGRFILFSLVVSAFSTWLPWVLAGLLLIEIGESFGVSVGVTGQIRTISSLLGVLTAFIMGALSVRISHRSLLLTSLSFITLSSIACYLAPNFPTILCVSSPMWRGSLGSTKRKHQTTTGLQSWGRQKREKT